MPGTSEPVAGKELSPRPFTATAEALDNYHEGLELDRDAGASVPSMIASIPDNSFSGASGFSNAFGNLWMRQEWELHRPLRLDEPYGASAPNVRIYDRRTRHGGRPGRARRGEGNLGERMHCQGRGNGCFGRAR